METIKACTDIEQSRKLADILPLDSADMYYDRYGDPYIINLSVTHERIKNDKYQHLIPCWSLTALLGVLPDNCGIDKEDGKYIASYIVSGECGTYTGDNPVDACVSMIEYLRKLKLL